MAGKSVVTVFRIAFWAVLKLLGSFVWPMDRIFGVLALYKSSFLTKTSIFLSIF